MTPVSYSGQSSGPSTRRADQQWEDENTVDYESFTKQQLQAALELRGLPTSGTKADLIERLQG